MRNRDDILVAINKRTLVRYFYKALDWWALPFGAGATQAGPVKGLSGQVTVKSSSGSLPFFIGQKGNRDMKNCAYYMIAVLFLVVFVTFLTYSCGGGGGGSSSGSSAPAPAPSDAWDPTDDSSTGGTWLTPTTSSQSHGPHTLSSTDQYDWYRINMTADYTYYFSTTYSGGTAISSGTGDSYGELYSDSGGSNRVALDDDSGGNTQFSLSYTAANTQYYYLRIRAYTVGNAWSGSLNYYYSVGTDTTPPTVSSVSPVKNSTGVSVSSNISVTFSEAMNQSTAQSAFSILPSVSGTFSWSGNTMTFDPTSDLAYNTPYTGAVNTAAKDLAGNNIASLYQWSFTTTSSGGSLPDQVTSPTPAYGATNVPITQQLGWASASGATSYDVYFGLTTTGWSPVNTTGTSYNPGTLSGNITVYYWRINSKNATGTTIGNLWWFITTSSGGGGDAWDPTDDTASNGTLLNPTTSNQSHGPHTLSATDQYDWYRISMTAGRTYYFNTTGGSGDNYGQLYSDSSGSNLVASDDDGGGSLQFSLSYTVANTQTYYLRIRAYTVGNAWSGSLNYYYASGGVPAQVTSPTPAYGTTNVPITQQLGWASAIGATSYDVYFGITITGWSPVTNTTGTSYNPGTLSGNITVYYWRINSKNSTGTTTGNLWWFITVAASATPSTWTIFVYGHADHNLTPSLLADIQEMRAATLGSHMNVIVRADFNTAYPGFSAYTGTQWYRITGGGNLIDLGKTAEVNSDNPNILASEIETVFTTYPANKYAIVFWDHGGSWDGGFGGDRNDTFGPAGAGMTVAQMATAVSTALTNTGISGTRPLEFIGYDTCLMAGNEVAYEFRNLAKTFIACAEIDFGDGWDYTSTLTYINNNPNLSAIGIAAQEVNNWNTHHIGKTINDDLVRSHMAMDLSKMDAYASAWFTLGDRMYFSETLYWIDVAGKQYKTLPGYSIDVGEPIDYPNLRDAGQFLNSLKTITSDSSVASDATATLNSLNAMILNVSNGSLRAGANQKGLHFEMPLAKNWAARSTDYTALNWDIKTEWSYLLDKLQLQSDAVSPTVNTTASNTTNPNAANPPTVLLNSADSDIVEAQLFIYQTIAGNLYDFGLIGAGYVNPSTQYQFKWDGKLFGLTDGTASSFVHFKRWIAGGTDAGGNSVPGLYAMQGILTNGTQTYNAYAVMQDGNFTVSLLVIESADGNINAESMEDYKGWRFTPQLYNVTTGSWVNQTTLTIPNTASPSLTFSEWSAAAGNYILATQITDVWGNEGAKADSVTVVTPFGN